MAIYSTFFIYAVDQLPRAFPGWKAPLAEPVARSFRNVFTGQTTTQLTREPTWEDGEIPDEPPQPAVVEIRGDYSQYLEGRLSRQIAATPHWCAKSITAIELDGLSAALGLSGPSAEDALFDRPTSGAVLLRLAPSLASVLGSARDLDLPAWASQWAAVMSTPRHTHSVSGRRVSPDWTPGDAMALLGPLVAVARRAEPGQGLYLLIEA